MAKQFIVKFDNGKIQTVNIANETSARFITEGVHPGWKIKSINCQRF